MAALELARYALGALSALFGLCYLYKTVYLILPLMKRPKVSVPAMVPAKPLDVAVLIAARNEEAVLPYLLDSIRAQKYAGTVSCFVIADNCTDGTAAIARAHGAMVWERHDKSRVGKGYALHALLGHMRAAGEYEKYDVFLIFDADNLLAPGYIAAMADAFARGHEAVCGYRNSKNFMANWLSAGSALWYIHDSAHLNASRAALGVTCAVTGTGFGLTRRLLDRTGDWSFFTLVEDVEFDTWCAVQGVPIGYCPQAMVYDEQPVTLGQSWDQRVRWVRGGIQVSLKYGRALVKGLFRGTARQRWGRLENLTLTLYGYGGCALEGAMSWLTALLAGTAALDLAAPLAWMYGGLFLAGVLTTVQERRRIPGTARQKILSCLTFPLFMALYIPIALRACVGRPQ